MKNDLLIALRCSAKYVYQKPSKLIKLATRVHRVIIVKNSIVIVNC